MNETETVAGNSSEERWQRSARSLLRLNLTVLGAGFAWFAYIDAPITDGAMRVFAASVLAGLASLTAALIGSDSVNYRAVRRAHRVALWLFVVATALMLLAATVTLNLKGSGGDDAVTQTALVIPA
jgi:predicted MFS family arabinose efflux permease